MAAGRLAHAGGRKFSFDVAATASAHENRAENSGRVNNAERRVQRMIHIIFRCPAGGDDESMRTSHEAIYQALYIQGCGALRRELSACLRTGRVLRVPRARTQQRGKRFITSEVLISERPAEVPDRAFPGHWEKI
uniref:Transposase n=1 Tax=Paraburkholderia sprentiae WSM5005 TaxID=754502 RepID=A0A1I9YUM0_9BURK